MSLKITGGRDADGKRKFIDEGPQPGVALSNSMSALERIARSRRREPSRPGANIGLPGEQGLKWYERER